MENSDRNTIFRAVLLVMFMSAVEMTVVTTVMPNVVAAIGGMRHFDWGYTAYMVSLCLAMPVSGRLADSVGRKGVILTGVLLFAGGSLVCGISPSMSVFVAARAVQGLGGGTMQPAALTIVSDSFAPEERGRAQGSVAAIWGLAGLCGPFLGALLERSASWRWVFILPVPASILVVHSFAKRYREAAPRAQLQLDVKGIIGSSALAVGLFLAGDPTHMAVGVATAAVAIVYLIWVERGQETPLFPPFLLKRRAIVVGNMIAALSGAVMFAALAFVPLFCQGVLGLSSAAAGETVAPSLVAWAVSSAAAGRLVPKLGARRVIQGGLAVMSATLVGLVIHLGGELSQRQLILTMVGIGVGLGFAHTALLLLTQASATWAERTTVTAAMMLARALGGSVGVGVLGAMLARRLEGAGVPWETSSHWLGPSRQSIAPSVAMAVTSAMKHGLDEVFLGMLCLCIAAFGSSLLFGADVALAAVEETATKEKVPSP